MDRNHRVTTIQRQFFEILDEFFRRVTGNGASTFATFDSFSTKISHEAQKLAPRMPTAYSFAGEALATFYKKYGMELFEEAKKIGGLNFVLGGATRFRQSQFESVRKVMLYADTVLIPDPILPWVEDPRKEEPFRHILLLETAFALLHLKPLVDADLPYPAVLVFPSYEKSLEKQDQTTKDGISNLTLGILKFYLKRDFANLEEMANFAVTNEAEFLKVIDDNHLYVAPNGEVGQSLSVALDEYTKFIKEWRSAEHTRCSCSYPEAIWCSML